MARPLLVALVIVGVGAGAFFAGRASVDRDRAPAAGGSYRNGREDAFSGFDGGWDFDMPYIVTLRHAGAGITYRFARRWTMEPGVAYRVCGRSVCSSRP